ncbi:MAG TPA: tetratricopeptide repeat protein [Gemmataceae bacterium]|nr:tetratricopeptide repeat protein [Gemmataceae bacterium]
MSPRLLFAYLVLSLIEPLLAFAKPPDLPMNMQVDCRNRCRPSPHVAQAPPRYVPPPPNYPLPSETAALEEALEEVQETAEQMCPCVDGCCIGFLEILGKIMEDMASNQAEEAEAPESEVLEVMPKEVQTPEEQPDQLSLSPRQSRARHLYRIGERCRRQGDLDMARNCYEEVCRIAPKSSYGIFASARLVRMNGQAQREPSARDAGEAQETPRESSTGNDEEQTLIEEIYGKADQLRRQTGEEPTCPFRRGQGPACPNPRPDAPGNDDDSMSDAEMQEVLDDSQFLDTYLDDLVNPDDSEEVDFLEDNSGAKPDRDRPEELTVAPAPRNLTIVEEPQRGADQSRTWEHRRRSVKQRTQSPRVSPPARVDP